MSCGGMTLTKSQVFDASDTTWNLHLQGAKILLQSIATHERSMPSLEFLGSWLEYHDTFSAYSLPCQLPVLQLEDVVLPESNTANRKVNSLGELLDS